MTVRQRVIKYCALAFAVFLIVSFALGAFELLSSLLEMDVLKKPGSGYLYSSVIGENISELDIDISTVALKITQGDKFALHTDNDRIKFYQDGSVLSVKDKEKFSLKPEGEVIIEVPAEKEFSKVCINAGAGEITVDSLCCSQLITSLGVGDFFAQRLVVTASADIDCAAGEFTVKDGSINNLEMNMALGDVTLDCFLTGEAEIDCGLGDMDMKLHGRADDYSIEVDKGICSARLNSESVKDENKYGNGPNRIEINGAVGDISIKTND